MEKTSEPDVMDQKPVFALSVFAPHIDTTFNVHNESAEPRSVQLIEASPSKHDTSEDPKNFALVFYDASASMNDHLPQAIYTFEHESLGTHQLFIVPIGIGNDGQGINYEAVFTSSD